MVSFYYLRLVSGPSQVCIQMYSTVFLSTFLSFYLYILHFISLVVEQVRGGERRAARLPPMTTNIIMLFVIK